MRYARIQDGLAAEFIDFDPTGKFNEALVWVECDETVAAGDQYDPETGAFTAPQPPSLNTLRLAARATINAWRDAQEDAGFEAIGHAWDSTPRSREKLTAVVMAGQGSPLGTWTSAADEDVPVTADDLLAIYVAMVTRGAQIHARQRALKAEVETMTREQLAAFVPGWQ